MLTSPVLRPVVRRHTHSHNDAAASKVQGQQNRSEAGGEGGCGRERCVRDALAVGGAFVGGAGVRWWGLGCIGKGLPLERLLAVSLPWVALLLLFLGCLS